MLVRICSRVDFMACLMIAAMRLDATLCHASVVSARDAATLPAVYRPYRNSPVLQRNRPYRYTTFRIYSKMLDLEIFKIASHKVVGYSITR